MKKQGESLKERLKSRSNHIRNTMKNIRKKYNVTRSSKYNLMFVIIVLGYLFFLSSNGIFNSEGDVMNTPFNKETIMTNIKVTMKSARYSNENRKLEVNFKIDKGNLTYDMEKLIIESKERNTPNEKVNSKIINLNEKDYVVVVDLPEEWTTVLLTFKENGENSQGIKFYVDKRESEEDSALKEKTRREYLRQSVDKEIIEVKEKITGSDDNIVIENQKNEKLISEIKRLQEEKKYLTESELIAMNQKIDQLKNEKLEVEKEVNRIKQEKEELTKKIEKLNIKREDYNKITD